jgi:hypothetical protein
MGQPWHGGFAKDSHGIVINVSRESILSSRHSVSFIPLIESLG